MDVHGTKLVRTLFTIATGIETVPPNRRCSYPVRRFHITMLPGQLTPNPLEIAVLEELARQDPSLLPFVGKLHVLSREYTGVGSFTNFDHQPATGSAKEPLSLAASVRVPGLSHGLGAILFFEGVEPSFLEFFAYDEEWTGVYDGFSLERTA